MSMLAYVFWHAPRPGVVPATYAASLRAFHGALAADRPPGFVASFTTSTSRLPWLDAEVAYEDWYLLTGSAALDPLDAAAVDAQRRAAHDDAARYAGIGTGGLYRLLSGAAIVPRWSVWLEKPDGTSYRAFAPVLDAFAASGATVWQRQMTLGPAAEFLVHARDDATAGRSPGGAVRVAHTKVAGAEL